tara:strand:- start:1890 stop:2837 length:948 start_codon:yes stop_codon:yes gene_type:complete
MKPGIYRGMSEKDYRAIKALNWSTIKHTLKSGLTAKHRMENPVKQSSAMKLGSLIHCAVLTPEEWSQSYSLAPDIEKREFTYEKERGEGGAVWTRYCDGQATTGFKTKSAAVADARPYTFKGDPGDGYRLVTEAKSVMGQHFAGIELCTAEQQRTAFDCLTALEGQEGPKRLLDATDDRELVAIWDHNGRLCKSRIDGYSKEYGLVWDLKTCQDAGFNGFKRTAIYNWKYHLQVAFYAFGLKAAAKQSGQDIWVNNVGFLAVESSAPYLGHVFVLNDDVRDLEVRALEALVWFITFQEADRWEGFPDWSYITAER